MPRLTIALLVLAGLATACYKDDSSGPARGRPMAKILLTDDPFPFDSVQSVKVYIVSIAVSTHPDTGTSADSMQWVTVAAPHRQIDLLTLQQGLTDSLGIGVVTADQYKAVLVTINVDSSAGIQFKNGSQATVRWNGSGQESYGVFVQAPVSVPDTGAVIVIDFDVGKSFVYNQLGDGAFDFFPWIRAVNRGATGGIAGTVTSDSSAGVPGPVGNATVTAYGGGPSNWYILSTGKTDAAGHYRLAFLLPGTYIVGVDPPTGSNAGGALDSNVAVNQGVETTHNVILSAFHGSILINGALSMLNNHTNRLEAFVVNAQHQQDTAAVVAWQSLDTAILGLTTYVDTTHVARVTSKAIGTGRIVATSGQLADTLVIHVAPDSSAGPSAHH
ncbi:MAG TPA: DUF4382 domain-containing protein [Gemmatimonadales bacterium]|nr:DUF4382 domain-containing protein [Gemmatimonadales bacterium]